MIGDGDAGLDRTPCIHKGSVVLTRRGSKYKTKAHNIERKHRTQARPPFGVAFLSSPQGGVTVEVDAEIIDLIHFIRHQSPRT